MAVATTLLQIGFPLKVGNTQRAGVFDGSNVRIAEAFGKLPLSFEANQGQTDSDVKFLSRGNGYSLFLTSSEAVLELRKPEARSQKAEGRNAQDYSPQSTRRTQRKEDSVVSVPSVVNAVLRMKLVGANPSPRVAGADELPGKSNYFIGNDPKKWRTNVATYAKVRYENVYSGIDLVYYGNQRQLEYDFVVSPGADPRAIRLDIQGADKLQINPAGDLVLETEPGREQVRLRKPVVYQEVGGARQEVSSGYRLEASNEVGFAVAAYDATKPLVIDPSLLYGGNLGGLNLDEAQAIAVDSSGNAYVTGQTNSVNFPLLKEFQSTITSAVPGATDAFVTKLNPDGSALVYSTYLGGTNTDEGRGIVVDGSGNAYVTGITASVDFPTFKPFQASYGGGPSKAFVTKLDPSGSLLVYSTYLGGTGQDAGNAIAVDSSGNVYLTGLTESPDFPTTTGALWRGPRGPSDAFVAKLDPTGSTLVYSTYLGGSGNDNGFGIAVDASGNAYVTGTTDSADFPTAVPYMNAFRGGTTDAFVSKLNVGGSAILYSTYLGGSGRDEGRGIALDAAGNIYVAGFTDSIDFPALTLIQPGFQGLQDGFVTKLNPAGSDLIYSTYLGGSNSVDIRAIAVDSAGNAYVTGFTSSADFPIKNPTESGGSLNGAGDGFITELNAGTAAVGGSKLVYSTFLGVGGYGTGIALDSSANVYVTGVGRIPGVGPYGSQPGGGFDDSFVAKIGTNLVPTLTALLPSKVTPGGPAFTLTVNGADFVSGAVVRWNGTARPTRFVSLSQLTASIAASDIAAAGTAQVTVFNPAPGGGSSSGLTFTIAPVVPDNPVPIMGFISPSITTAGGAAFTLTVNGTNFVSASVVQWNGSSRTTTFVSATQLTVSIPATDIAAAGTVQVTVFNPLPGGGTSAALIFTINNPLPTLSSLTPASALAGGVAFTLTVNGTNFVSASVVQWNGSSRTTTFVNATKLTVSIPATDIATTGTAQVTVMNPSPGGGSSNALSFAIIGPVISPGGILNGASYTLTSSSLAPGSIASIFGFNLSDGTVCFPSNCGPSFDSNGKVLPIQFGAQVTFNGIPAAILFTPGSTQLNVQIPVELAGGAASATVEVTANGQSSAPFTVSLAPLSPGLISINSNGSGQGAILNDKDANQLGVQSLVAPASSVPNAHPAAVGDVIEIYGTGLGAVTPPVPTGMRPPVLPQPQTVTPPSVMIGGIQAKVLFSGLASCCVGLNQVNVVVPPGTPAGNAIQVVLSIGGVNSNTVTIAVQ